jgi:hypothetical protein
VLFVAEKFCHERHEKHENFEQEGAEVAENFCLFLCSRSFLLFIFLFVCLCAHKKSSLDVGGACAQCGVERTG